MPELKDAPLPWTITAAALFECQIVSAPINGGGARAIVYQGPRETADFIMKCVEGQGTRAA